MLLLVLLLAVIGVGVVIFVISGLTFFEWFSRQIVKSLDEKGVCSNMFNSIKSICKCIGIVFSANAFSMLGVLVLMLAIAFIMKMQDVVLTDNILRLIGYVSYVIGVLIDFTVIYLLRKSLLEYETVIIWVLKLLIYFNSSVFCGIVGVVAVCLYWYLVYIKEGDDMYV